MDTIQRLVLAVAAEQIGMGEEGGNNRGPVVAGYRNGLGKDGDPWCAAFVSWCYSEASGKLMRPMPFRYTLSARKLCRQLVPTEQPVPGDVVLWSRGAPWQGHVGLYAERLDCSGFRTIEGNVGKYPSVVREYTHELGEPRLIGFYRVRI